MDKFIYEYILLISYELFSWDKFLKVQEKFQDLKTKDLIICMSRLYYVLYYHISLQKGYINL